MDRPMPKIMCAAALAFVLLPFDAAAVQVVEMQGTHTIYQGNETGNMDSSGGFRTTMVWDRILNGPGEAKDEAHGIAVDSKGNVFVAGASFATKDGEYLPDAVVVKYSSNGTPVWQVYFSGDAGSSADLAHDVTVDIAGDVYVAGETTANGSQDGLIIKYSGATGLPVWTTKLNGLGNCWDSLQKIALSQDGDVIVAGLTTGMGGGRDVIVAKYANDGSLVWPRLYSGPGKCNDFVNDLKVDTSGNIYLAGIAWDGAQKCLALKYDRNGDLLWEARYAGRALTPGTTKAVGYSIAFDSEGNAFVAGSASNLLIPIDKETHLPSGPPRPVVEWILLKYDPSGTLLWKRAYSGSSTNESAAHGVLVDNGGNAYVTGHVGSSAATMKFDRKGARLWVSGGPSCHYIWQIRRDATGDIYVAGSTKGAAFDLQGLNFAVAKYRAADGAPVWTEEYNGPASSHDWLTDMAVDAAGNVHLTGWVEPEDPSHLGIHDDIETVKYAASDKP